MTNLEGFADFDVICEAPFLFSLHFSDDFEVFFVEMLREVLVVLCDSGMAPCFVVYGTAMFLPSVFKRSGSLANVYCFV